ncbi:MAG: chromate transporter [Eubacterium sp.]|nr:chromate transporter [Eubacterium sp.]
MIYLRLYWEFFKTGLFTIGGGLATLPFLYEMQAKTGWFTVQDIANMVAISESTPGPMGINMATFTGFTVAGIPGGIIAPIGLVTPSIIVIVIIANILERFKTNKYVQYAMYGLRAASAGLIAIAGLKVAQIAFLHPELFKETHNIQDLFNPIAIIFALALYLVYKKTNKHPILYIAASAVMGIVLMM